MNSIFANVVNSQTIGPSSILTILFSLILALLAGLFIAWIYRRNYRGVMYSNNFTLTLVMMTLITCPVVMCIRESIQLSMGMVGALSIVRFRTAVKDPLDTAYMFWALTMGILLGAGQFFLTACAVVGIGLLLTVLVHIQTKGINSYYLTSDGSTMSYRTRIRTPSYAHLQQIPAAIRGSLVSDLIVYLGSIDFVMSDVDR